MNNRRYWFGMKYSSYGWNIATALIPSRASMVHTISIQKEIDPESEWVLGSCSRDEIDNAPSSMKQEGNQ